MIVLIAESKSMSAKQVAVTPESPCCSPTVGESVLPCYEFEADAIMAGLRGLTASELSDRLKVGPKSAAAMVKMVYDFPDKNHGYRAIDAFSGVVFKALDAASLSPEAMERARRGLRIVSSAYGWLAPDDIIKPYRLDYSDRIAPDGRALSAFWRSRLTVSLVNLVKTSGCREVLNLLPADASKCIDWKAVKAFASVYVANFQQAGANGLSTPGSGRLKTLRGLLLRHILETGISSGDMLRSLDTDFCYYDTDAPYPGHLQLITD